jgi:hypothetical protein
VVAPPLDSNCDGPATYPGDIKTLVKSSKERSGPTIKCVLISSKILSETFVTAKRLY